MPLIRLSLLFLVICTSPTFADKAADEEAVWKLEEAYWQFVKNNDIDGYRSLWDERFVGWPGFSESPVLKKNIADWIAPLHANPALEYDYELTKGAVRSFGEVVVAHYLVRDYSRSLATGKETNVDLFRVTHTWQRRGDSWQIITGMSGSWVSEDYEQRRSVPISPEHE